METLWFILVAAMLTAYVVLDGFDLGAGIINFNIAKTAAERHLVLRTIGPVWDGNEVWLIAAGGALYFAFPRLYASSFSGFYLPLMIVLWLLMLRGIGIELRSHVANPLWWSFFDFVFSSASFLLALFYGAAIGNVIRGVDLGPDGYFFEALWTNFRVGPSPGILDWYTLLTGLLALVTLSVHGGNFVALKAEGSVYERVKSLSSHLWIALALMTVISLIATLYIRPEVMANFSLRPWGWIIPVIVLLSLIAMRLYQLRGRDLAAFLASSVYIIAMLGGAAFAMYPYLLRASTNAAYSLTVYNSQTGSYSLTVGLVWWLVGMILAVGYFTFLYGSFRGKIKSTEAGY